MGKTVTIDSQKVNCHDATVWAMKQFGRKINIENMFPSNRWIFKFEESEHATLFALKWLK